MNSPVGPAHVRQQAREPAKGTLTKMDWVNPHGRIHVDVKGPDGKVVNWAIETGAPNARLRRGLRKTDFPPGTQVTIQGLRAKDGTNPAQAWDIPTEQIMPPSYHSQTLAVEAAAAEILKFENSATEHGWRRWLASGTESAFLKAVEAFKSALDDVLDTPLAEFSEADLTLVGRQVDLAAEGIEAHVAHAGERHALVLVTAIYAIRRRHEEIARRGAGHVPPSR